MTIRPIDMQIILPYVTDVSKVQAVQNDQSHNAQQQFAEKLQKEAQNKKAKVQETKSGEFSKITRDKEREQQKNKNSNKFSQQKEEQQHPKEQAKKRDGLDPQIGKNLDISS